MQFVISHSHPNHTQPLALAMSKAHPPELKKLMDKRLTLKLNANRQVTGILRGFDPFMNVVVDETIDTTPGNKRIGSLSCHFYETLKCVLLNTAKSSKF